MPYSAEISRSNPTCFVFLLDQSGSMADRFGATEMVTSKAQFLADVVNRTIHDLVLRCSSTEEIRNYYEVAIIGYGTSVGSCFGGALSNRDWVAISDVANNPTRIDQRLKKSPDGAGGLVDQPIKFPIWIEPQASGQTPMCAAMEKVNSLVSAWVTEHPMAFPPTILHITDGESTDGDPSEIGQRILATGTSDGKALLFNCHLSSHSSAKVEYPTNSESLPNDFARNLFGFSSTVPSAFRSTAQSVGVTLPEGARSFVFNADPVSLAQFFEIGTRPAALR